MSLRVPLPPRAERVLAELLVAANNWGWQQENGHGAAVGKAETRYNAAVAAMRRHLRRPPVAVQAGKFVRWFRAFIGDDTYRECDGTIANRSAPELVKLLKSLKDAGVNP